MNEWRSANVNSKVLEFTIWIESVCAKALKIISLLSRKLIIYIMYSSAKRVCIAKHAHALPLTRILYLELFSGLDFGWKF